MLGSEEAPGAEEETDEHDRETLHRLCPTYAKDINSPLRHVRTRIYFTSESHVHSLINVLRFCHLGECLGNCLTMVTWLRILGQIMHVHPARFGGACDLAGQCAALLEPDLWWHRCSCWPRWCTYLHFTTVDVHESLVNMLCFCHLGKLTLLSVTISVRSAQIMHKLRLKTFAWTL